MKNSASTESRNMVAAKRGCPSINHISKRAGSDSKYAHTNEMATPTSHNAAGNNYQEMTGYKVHTYNHPPIYILYWHTIGELSQ